MMIIVYAIRSISRKYIYVGMTNDLKRRLEEHNKGEKSGSGKEFLKALS
jgi:putative endonuclease